MVRLDGIIGLLQMAQDIFHSLSKPELKKEIATLVAKDKRSLPGRAKVFAAVAAIQKFDQLPESATTDEIDKSCAEGATELNRGIASGNGILAKMYARELLLGPLYPGTQSAMGNGIHLAEPSIANGAPGFQKISVIAQDYASRGKPGMIVRCVLRTDVKRIDFHGLKDYFRENKNRNRDVGISDAGAFAAALGFEAISCDNVYDHTNERCWIVLNRSALTFQQSGLQIA